MGIFTAPPVIPDDLLSKLTGDSRRSRGRLAKVQDVIRSEFAQGETPLLIAVDIVHPIVGVITNKRVFLVWGRRVDKSATPDRISRTRLGKLPNGYLAIIDGPGMNIQFATYEEANQFVGAIDHYLLSSNVVPRDIPPLFPNFFHDVLVTTGKPVNPDNMFAITDRVVRMISSSAASYFEQSGDNTAQSRFTSVFSADETDGAVLARWADLMIDFLWEWDPRSHDPLRRLIPRIKELLTGPDSFLWECGNQLPMWDDLTTS
jgi:hypothetical protein